MRLFQLDEGEKLENFEDSHVFPDKGFLSFALHFLPPLSSLTMAPR
jgi:hypothetical protein